MNERRIPRHSTILLRIAAMVLLSAAPPERAAAHCGAFDGVMPKGVHDGTNCKITWGWACDADNWDAPLEVEVWEGSQKLATVNANKTRNDLNNPEPDTCGGVVTHGFEYKLPASLKDGAEHFLDAYAIDCGGTQKQLLQNNPLTIRCDATPPVVTFAVPLPSTTTEASIVVSVQVEDAGGVAEVTLQNLTTGQTEAMTFAFGGWVKTIPLQLGANQLKVTAEDESGNVGSLSATVTREPDGGAYEPRGSHDGSTCAITYGWACDPDDYGAALTVEIREGSTLLGTVTANTIRNDVTSACGGNPAHGFNFTIPAALKDGQMHRYDAYARHSDGFGAKWLGFVTAVCGCTYPNCYKSGPLRFTPVAPCRLYETVTPGQPLVADQSREITVAPGPCGLPTSALAVSANLTIVNPTNDAVLTAIPADEPSPPLINLMHVPQATTRINNTILKLPVDGSRKVKVLLRGAPAGTTTHLILDVNGYFR